MLLTDVMISTYIKFQIAVKLLIKIKIEPIACFGKKYENLN